MARATITRIRDLVRNANYVVTTLAADELEDDQLTIHDLEAVILTGAIIERQRDQATGETKFIIRGRTTEGTEAECVVKIGATGWLIVITVYRAISQN